MNQFMSSLFDDLYVDQEEEEEEIDESLRMLPPPKVVDPKWVRSNEKHIKNSLYQSPVHATVEYYPDDYGLGIGKGAWVLVRELPPLEFVVPPLSIWWATPWPMDSNFMGRKVQRIKIITPKGALGLMPSCGSLTSGPEYSVVDDIKNHLKYVGRGLRIRTLSEGRQ